MSHEMNTEELRAIIWDDLFHKKTAKSIDEIAAQTDKDATAIRAVVDHDWFSVNDNLVSIAMMTANPQQK
jgi:hypothetical protein